MTVKWGHLKVKWQTTKDTKYHHKLLIASASNISAGYLVHKSLSHVLKDFWSLLVSQSRSSSTETKCLLAVSVMALAPVWITWPGGCAGEPPRGFRDNARHPEDNSSKHTHPHQITHSRSCLRYSQSLRWLCRHWPAEGRMKVPLGHQLLLMYKHWYMGNERHCVCCPFSWTNVASVSRQFSSNFS